MSNPLTYTASWFIFYRICFPVLCLREDDEFDCMGSFSVSFLYTEYFHTRIATKKAKLQTWK